jgi:hypothetical protein
MALPLPSFDRHQCRLDLNDLRFKRLKEEKMKQLPQVLFWLGLISIPFAWLVWYVGPQMEMVRPVLASISDPALRAALQEAHAERLGLWVAVWPVTLLVLSLILETKVQE